MEHLLHKPWSDDCDCRKHPDTPCPVCEWGAAMCKVCGAAEGELDDMTECPGHKNWRDEIGEIRPEFLTRYKVAVRLHECLDKRVYAKEIEDGFSIVTEDQATIFPTWSAAAQFITNNCKPAAYMLHPQKVESGEGGG